MNIYIASSWKNFHAVEMLTERLELQAHVVWSFVRDARAKDAFPLPPRPPEWLDSDAALTQFHDDTAYASNCDTLIYIGPSGPDAWAEVAIAWSCNIPILALAAPGEPIGIMRHMVTWFTSTDELLQRLPAFDEPAPQP